MYQEILKKHGVLQTPEFTLRVLISEVGKLNTIGVYKERFGPSGYQGDEEAETSDLYTQIMLLIEQKGYNLKKIQTEGLERFDHRIGEITRRQLMLKHGNESSKGDVA